MSYHLLHLHLSAPWESAGVSWIVPVMTFTVLTGLNTDYDVFLVSGVSSAFLQRQARPS